MSNEVERLRAELAAARVERDRAMQNLIDCRERCRRLATRRLAATLECAGSEPERSRLSEADFKET